MPIRTSARTPPAMRVLMCCFMVRPPRGHKERRPNRRPPPWRRQPPRKPLPLAWPQVDFIEPSGLTSLQLSPAAQRHEHPTRGSAERADDFAVSVLRERLQRLRAHEAEAPELQYETGHDGVVRCLAGSDKVELAHHHVKLLHFATHGGK